MSKKFTMLKKDYAECASSHGKFEEQRQLIAGILAYAYLKNAGAVLEPKAFQRAVEDYTEDYPLANPGDLKTVREAILTKLDEFIKGYESYRKDEPTL